MIFKQERAVRTDDQVVGVTNELIRLVSRPLTRERLGRFPILKEICRPALPATPTRDQFVRQILGLISDAIGSLDAVPQLRGFSPDVAVWRTAYRTILDLGDGGQQADAPAPRRRRAAWRKLTGDAVGTEASIDKRVRQAQDVILRPLAERVLIMGGQQPNWLVHRATYHYEYDEDAVLIRSHYVYEVECLAAKATFTFSHRSNSERGWLRLQPLESGEGKREPAFDVELAGYNTDVIFKTPDAKEGDHLTLEYALRPDRPAVSDGLFAATGQLSVLSLEYIIDTAVVPDRAWWFERVLPELDSAPPVRSPASGRHLLTLGQRLTRTFELPPVGMYFGIKVEWPGRSDSG